MRMHLGVGGGADEIEGGFVGRAIDAAREAGNGNATSLPQLARQLLGKRALHGRLCAVALVHEDESLQLLVAQLVLLAGVIEALGAALALALFHARGQALAHPPFVVVHPVHADAERSCTSA